MKSVVTLPQVTTLNNTVFFLFITHFLPTKNKKNEFSFTRCVTVYREIFVFISNYSRFFWNPSTRFACMFAEPVTETMNRFYVILVPRTQSQFTPYRADMICHTGSTAIEFLFSTLRELQLIFPPHPRESYASIAPCSSNMARVSPCVISIVEIRNEKTPYSLYLTASISISASTVL